MTTSTIIADHHHGPDDEMERATVGDARGEQRDEQVDARRAPPPAGSRNPTTTQMPPTISIDAGERHRELGERHAVVAEVGDLARAVGELPDPDADEEERRSRAGAASERQDRREADRATRRACNQPCVGTIGRASRTTVSGDRGSVARDAWRRSPREPGNLDQRQVEL